MLEDALRGDIEIIHPFYRRDYVHEAYAIIREHGGSLGGSVLRTIVLVALLGAEFSGAGARDRLCAREDMRSVLGSFCDSETWRGACLPVRARGGYVLLCTNATSGDVLDGELFAGRDKFYLAEIKITPPVKRGGKLMFMTHYNIGMLRAGEAPRIAVFEHSGAGVQVRAEQVSGDTLVRVGMRCAGLAGCGPDEFARMIIEMSSGGSGSGERSSALARNFEELERMGYVVRSPDGTIIIVDDNASWKKKRALTLYQRIEEAWRRLGKLLVVADAINSVVRRGGRTGAPRAVGARGRASRLSDMVGVIEIIDGKLAVRGSVLASERIEVVEEEEDELVTVAVAVVYERVIRRIEEILRAAGLDAEARFAALRRITLDAGGVRVTLTSPGSDVFYGVLTRNFFVTLLGAVYTGGERILRVRIHEDNYYYVADSDERAGIIMLAQFTAVPPGEQLSGRHLRRAYLSAYSKMHGGTPAILSRSPDNAAAFAELVPLEDAHRVVDALVRVSRSVRIDDSVILRSA